MELKTTVRFTNPYCSIDTTVCYTEITVREIKYGSHSDTEYYSISYKHRFVSEPYYKTNEKLIDDESPPVVYPHPFANDCNDKALHEMKDGNIIVKNDLTGQLVRFLLMPDEELAKYIGKTCPSDYRRTLVHDIAKKWD